MCFKRPSVQCDLFAGDGTLNTANDNINNIRRDLQQSSNDICAWCCRNRMALNPTKTKCLLMATRQKHQKQQLSLNLNFENTPIEQVSKHRLLGVTVDNNESGKRILTIFSELFLESFLLSKLSQIFLYQAKYCFFFAHIMPHKLCLKCM